MQVCRYAASLIQGKPGKGEGLDDPGVLFFLRVSRICPCSRGFFFFGRASPTGPRKRKPDSALFPSGRRQPNQKSIRLVHCDMFLSSCRNAVNGRACLCSPCKGPGVSMRCRISGAGKSIARSIRGADNYCPRGKQHRRAGLSSCRPGPDGSWVRVTSC